MRHPTEDRAQVVGRLAKARTQIDRALIDWWGLPERAMVWGYLGLDNCIHCALVAAGLDAGKNHASKLDKFFEAYPEARDPWSPATLKRYCTLWNKVRYGEAQVERSVVRDVLKVAHELHSYCADKVQQVLGLDAASFQSLMSHVEEEQREIRQASLEGAAQLFEHDDMSIEASLESMGLPPFVAQLANPGRDAFVYLSSDRQWVRQAIEQDEDIAERLAQMRKAFREIITRLMLIRAERLLKEDPNLIHRPEELVAPLRDFNLVGDLYYSGLVLLEFWRSAIASGALGQAIQESENLWIGSSGDTTC